MLAGFNRFVKAVLAAKGHALSTQSEQLQVTTFQWFQPQSQLFRGGFMA